jgi:hypothetical protein
MMNYRVIEKDNSYGVFETQTGLIVFKDKDRMKVSERCRWLNLGGCFDGWTPKYILHENFQVYLTVEDVNLLFEEFLLGEES